MSGIKGIALVNVCSAIVASISSTAFFVAGKTARSKNREHGKDFQRRRNIHYRIMGKIGTEYGSVVHQARKTASLPVPHLLTF